MSIKMMEVLKDNIPHPKDMDFLVYLVSLDHPDSVSFIEYVLLPEIKQSIMIRNRLEMVTIEDRRLILRLKQGPTYEFFRLTNIRRHVISSITNVYRGFTVERNSFVPLTASDEKQDILFSLSDSLVSDTIKIDFDQGSPMEVMSERLTKKQKELEHDIFMEAKMITSTGFTESNEGQETEELLNELDNVIDGIDNQINTLMREMREIKDVKRKVRFNEDNTRDMIAQTYINELGEENEELSDINRQLGFFL